jgi:hypothetical protein
MKNDKSKKKEKDLEDDLKGLIEQNTHQTEGMKKLINSIKPKKDNQK